MTEFGGEWIQAFPKDSWANVTNEYEPYTFNDYGSKIPLQELRPTTVDAANRTIVVDAENKTTMTVYMEMSVNGDYEMRYGNPQLVTTNDKSRRARDRWQTLSQLAGTESVSKCVDWIILVVQFDCTSLLVFERGSISF